VAPHIVDVDKGGTSAVRKERIVGKAVSRVVVTCEFVSGRNQRTQTTSFYRAETGWENANAVRIQGDVAATPMFFIFNERASPFDNL